MTYTPMQPMEAPDYEESSKVLTNPMQAVFDSAKKDFETAETNANKNSQTSEALGAFSTSLNNLAQTAADKYIKEREAAGLNLAMMDGSISQEVVDQHHADVDKMEKESNSIQKLAAKIEENDDHDIVSERVRSADPYFQYGFKLGKLRQMTGDIPMLLEQLKGVITVKDEETGEEKSYDNLREYDDIADWNGQARTHILKAFIGVSPALLKEEVFTTLTTAFERSSRQKAVELKQKRKDERTRIVEQTFFEGIEKLESGDDNALQSFFNNSVGRDSKYTPTEAFTALESLASNNGLSTAAIEKLAGIKIIDRSTGKPTTIGAKFPYDIDKLENTVLTATVRKTQTENTSREQINLKNAEKLIETFLSEEDEDGFNLTRWSEYREEIVKQPNSSQALRRWESIKDQAVDFYTTEEKNSQYFRYKDLIFEKVLGWQDVTNQVSNREVRERLENYMRSIGMKPGDKPYADKYSMALQTIRDDIENAVGLTPDMKAHASVGYEILFHQNDFIRKVKEAEQSGQASDVLPEWRKMFKDLIDRKKNPGYMTADAFPKAIPRHYKSQGIAPEEQERIIASSRLQKQAETEGKSIFEMPFYTEKQRVSAVQNFIKTGDADPFTEQLARQAKMTPYELLNGINNHMIGADIPVPQEVRTFTDNITEAQRTALRNYSSVQHLRRIQGGPFPLVSQAPSALPVDTRQRGNEMLEYMLGPLNKGLTRNHAIGLLVNMQRESSLRTTNPGDGGHSDGLFQWNGPAGRLGPARAALGRDWDNWKAQIKYALEEPGYEAVVAEFLNTQWSTPQQAADFWMRRWEIPKDKVGASETHRDFIPQWMN